MDQTAGCFVRTLHACQSHARFFPQRLPHYAPRGRRATLSAPRPASAPRKRLHQRADAFAQNTAEAPPLRTSTGLRPRSDSSPSLLRARCPLWSSPGLRPCGIATACAGADFSLSPLRVCCAKKNPSVTAPLLAWTPDAAAVPAGRCSLRLHVGPSLRFSMNGPTRTL
jgi:hypothetical protein